MWKPKCSWTHRVAKNLQAFPKAAIYRNACPSYLAIDSSFVMVHTKYDEMIVYTVINLGWQ